MRETSKNARTDSQARPPEKYPDGSGEPSAQNSFLIESLNLSGIFRICLGLAMVFLWSLVLFGAADDSNEAIARDIEDNLIAPCCWSTPVSQHYSPVADEIRAEVRTMLAEGKSRDEILSYYEAEYGERILAAPRAEGFNMLAYVLPWAALILGAWLLIVLIKKLRSPAPVSSPEKAPEASYASRIEKELKEFEE